jgi:hypothetical protein
MNLSAPSTSPGASPRAATWGARYEVGRVQWRGIVPLDPLTVASSGRYPRRQRFGVWAPCPPPEEDLKPASAVVGPVHDGMLRL